MEGLDGRQAEAAGQPEPGRSGEQPMERPPGLEDLAGPTLLIAVGLMVLEGTLAAGVDSLTVRHLDVELDGGVASFAVR